MTSRDLFPHGDKQQRDGHPPPSRYFLARTERRFKGGINLLAEHFFFDDLTLYLTK
jgi:hypothetical protein